MQLTDILSGVELKDRVNSSDLALVNHTDGFHYSWHKNLLQVQLNKSCLFTIVCYRIQQVYSWRVSSVAMKTNKGKSETVLLFVFYLIPSSFPAHKPKSVPCVLR